MGLDRLPEGYRPELGEPDAGSVPARVLVPRSGRGISAKVLNGTAAEVVQALGAAGPLPGTARGEAEANEAVARLVLDGALEIEEGDRFVSGPAAHGAVFEPDGRAPAEGRLAELSLGALRYGQALAIADVGALSRRLYMYGAVPRGPRWDRLLGAADEVTGLLGLGPGGRASDALSGDYQALTHPNWISWSRGLDGSRPELPYKLYVSPLPEALAESFPTVAEVLAAHGVSSFKLGRGVPGLLRPDKVVAYLEDLDRLERLAGDLAGALAGCPAHGVPFTAEASADGLLSWGMDPPPGERLLSSQPVESWRLWLTNRLASGIVHAQSASCAVEPWEFAVDRLALEGVDTSTWLPADTIWGDPEAA